MATIAKVSVVVLNWNGRDHTLECLKSLTELDYPNFDIVVVDNGSTDDSIGSVQASFPAVCVIETGVNLGYAGGNNVGIRHALSSGADYVLILNNDTTVHPGLLTALVTAGEGNRDAGLLGPMIYHHSRPDTLWCIGANWREDLLEFELVNDGMDSGFHQQMIPTDTLIGCAMFIRRDVFARIGLLDASYFLCWEEFDFCTRAHRAGFACRVVREAKIWHKGAVSFGGLASPGRVYYDIRNRLLWARRYLPIASRWAVYRLVWRQLWSALVPHILVAQPGAGRLTARLYWAAAAAVRGVSARLKRPANRAMLYGIRDHLLRRYGPCPENVRKLVS